MKRMTVKPVRVEGGYTIIASANGIEESPVKYRVIETRKEACKEIESLYNNKVWDLKKLATGYYSISVD